MAMLQQLLFALLIFFLPSNLAYHFNSSTAIVQGTLVDYLIPKLYLTDIFILGILILELRKTKLKFLTFHFSLLIFFSITLVRGLLTTHPLAATYFWIKLIQLALFVSWLRSHLVASRYTLIAALPLAVIWQSLLALAQWLKQSSIVGYWFLGEPLFNLATPGIAKSGLAGSLKVLPYGTTPHPNVLAGFIALSLVLIWPSKSLSKYIAIILGSITLFLTQSASAWLSLILITVFIGLKHLLSTKAKIVLIFVLILGLFTSRYWLDTDSLYRRHQLNLAAVNMWTASPLFGVGLNQFTAYLPQYTEISASTRFLQPVHNIYLLWLSETGLIGFVVVILLLWKLLKIENWKLKIPILMVLTIGLADHYPLTLQAGQLLLAISLGFSAAAKSPSSSAPPVQSARFP